jgi:uncharacterized membrane protein YhaH (DUF805 family)
LSFASSKIIAPLDAWIKAIPTIMFFAIILGFIVAFYALAAKRLHDRNKSGWWIILFVNVPNGIDKATDKMTEGTLEWWVFLIVSLGLSLWGLAEMGFLRGTAGPNDYGDDPLGGTAVIPAEAPQHELQV